MSVSKTVSSDQPDGHVAGGRRGTGTQCTHKQVHTCRFGAEGLPSPQIETRSMPNWQRHVAARDKVLRSRYPRTFDVFGEGGPWSSNLWEHHSHGMSSADKYKLYIASGEEWFAKDRRHLICINFQCLPRSPRLLQGFLSRVSFSYGVFFCLPTAVDGPEAVLGGGGFPFFFWQQ